MTAINILTDRLRLVPPSQAHQNCFLAFYASPRAAVQGWTRVGAQAVAFWDFICDHWSRRGFGWFVIEEAEGGAPIGMCGLIRRDTLPDVDLGFAFLPEAWGQGLAREAAAAVLDHARDAFRLRRVLAITDPENAASIRVLERIGMRRERTVRLPGEAIDLLLFGVDLPPPP